MKNAIFFSISLILFLLFVNVVNAAEVLVFDSTDNYLGGCKLTNKSEWNLKEDTYVTKFQIWYNWDQGETTLPVTVYQEGKKFAEFDATRSECDPYQKQWCNANYIINKMFTKGAYSVEIPESKMCLKPGSTGTVRLYNEGTMVKKEQPLPTPTITPKSEITNIQPTAIAAQSALPCSCSQTIILVTAAATSAITSFIVALLMRR